MKLTRQRLLAALLMLTCCSRGGKSESLQAARETITKLVDGTASVAGNGLPTTSHPDPGAEACANALGKSKGTVRFGYRVEIALTPDSDVGALVARTQRFWTDAGYSVQELSPKTGTDPSIRAERDGYGVTLDVWRSQGMLAAGLDDGLSA